MADKPGASLNYNPYNDYKAESIDDTCSITAVDSGDEGTNGAIDIHQEDINRARKSVLRDSLDERQDPRLDQTLPSPNIPKHLQFSTPLPPQLPPTSHILLDVQSDELRSDCPHRIQPESLYQPFTEAQSTWQPPLWPYPKSVDHSPQPQFLPPSQSDKEAADDSNSATASSLPMKSKPFRPNVVTASDYHSDEDNSAESRTQDFFASKGVRPSLRPRSASGSTVARQQYDPIRSFSSRQASVDQNAPGDFGTQPRLHSQWEDENDYPESSIRLPSSVNQASASSQLGTPQGWSTPLPTDYEPADSYRMFVESASTSLQESLQAQGEQAPSFGDAKGISLEENFTLASFENSPESLLNMFTQPLGSDDQELNPFYQQSVPDEEFSHMRDFQLENPFVLNRLADDVEDVDGSTLASFPTDSGFSMGRSEVRGFSNVLQNWNMSFAPTDNASFHGMQRSSSEQSFSDVDVFTSQAVSGKKRAPLSSSSTSYVPHRRMDRRTPFLCEHCDERPNGFNGEHELTRHVKMRHTPNRTMFVCQAPADNPTFLDGCRQCRIGKKYGAYYDAAQHIRRCHLNPIQRGRRPRSRVVSESNPFGRQLDSPPLREIRKYLKEVTTDQDGNALEIPNVEIHPTVGSVGLRTPTPDAPQRNDKDVDVDHSPEELFANEHKSAGLVMKQVYEDSPEHQDKYQFPHFQDPSTSQRRPSFNSRLAPSLSSSSLRSLRRLASRVTISIQTTPESSDVESSIEGLSESEDYLPPTESIQANTSSKDEVENVATMDTAADEGFSTDNVALDKLAQELQGEHGIQILDRRWHLRLYPSCFTGTDLVTWLIQRFRDIREREHAQHFGNVLMNKGLFQHVNGKNDFRDSQFYYQITPEYRVPKERMGWFGSTRHRQEISVPLTPKSEMEIYVREKSENYESHKLQRSSSHSSSDSESSIRSSRRPRNTGASNEHSADIWGREEDKDLQDNLTNELSTKGLIIQQESSLDGLFEHIREQKDLPRQNRRQAYSDNDSVISEGSSIWSHQSSLSSASSLASQSIHGSYLAQLVDLFWNDSEIQHLSHHAIVMEHIGKDRLERNFPRLLKILLTDLRKEVETKGELRVLRFARSQFRSVSKEMCSRAAQKVDFKVAQPPAKKYTEIIENSDIEDSSSDNEDTSDSDNDEQDDVSHDVNWVKEFLKSSWAFAAFRNNLKNFVNPTFQSKLGELNRNLKKSIESEDEIFHLGHIISELRQVDPAGIVVQSHIDIGWQDRIKTSIEVMTREKWDWWPLESPRRPFAIGKVCLEWTCACGDKRWEYVPKGFAEDISRITRQYGNESNSDPSDSSISHQHQSHTNYVTFHGKGKAFKPDKLNYTNPPFFEQSIESQPYPAMDSNLSLWILLIVRSGTTHRLSQIAVKDKDTAGFFRAMRDEYFRLRGWFRQLFSVWRFSHCEFYRCEKFDSYEYAPKKKNEYPNIRDPEYQYQPKPMVEIPPIGAHEFYKRFYSCSSSIFSRRQKCDQAKRAHACEALSLLPKRISELNESSETRETFWGIYAREVICFRWLVFYNFLCFLPLITFFILSMTNFEFRDVILPFSMTLGMLSVFWCLYIASLEYGGKRI